ncbi:hypothetical protein [Cohnella soli]|uniref:Aminoglycoside phosphotransferase domain-containing protein n=1 Tax=Cohnella soli TaxID=425005 RepID=A0ABW0HMZ8_9BACL
MYVVTPLPSDILELLESFLKTNDLPIWPPTVPGSRSNVYRIRDYALKVYTRKGTKDGETECKALLALQKTSAPILYAYQPGVFVLMEWIEGVNLSGYRDMHEQLPPDLIYDMFRTELGELQAGFKDWDFKLSESLLWTDSGEVKRLDFGICEPVPSILQNQFQDDLIRKIEGLYNNDPESINNLMQKFLFNGIRKADFAAALESFQAKTPRLV